MVTISPMWAKPAGRYPGICKGISMLKYTKLFFASLFALAFSMFGAPAFAVGPDLTTVTSAVDFGTVTTAILGVAAAVVVVYLAWKGAKMVIAAVRGA